MMKKNQDCGTDSSFVSSDTQPIYSPSLPPDKAGGKLIDDCDTQYIECTLPLEDVHLLGDGINTQILDVDGQTQVLDPFGETQVLDDWNTTGVSINDGDEESGKTEFLGDTQVLSDDDCVERGSGGLFDVRSTPNNSLKKDISRDAEPLLDVVSNDGQGSGSIVHGFTFVRAASLRASGLAARNRALNEMNTKSFSPKRDDFLLRQTADKDTCQLENGSNQQNSHVDFAQMNESGHKNLQKVGSSTVRKLFTDDEVRHIKQADNGNKPDKSGLRSFAFENVLEELNYVNSEEPGDLSQANALKVVDKFIELNVVDGDSDAVLIKSTGGKGKLISSARGVKSLAKKGTTKSTNALSGTYYWDDNLEDEGGGEFFQKNKVLLLKSNLKHSTKKGTVPSCLRSKSRITCQKTREKEKPDTKRKSNADDLSDSRLMSNNLRVNRQSPSQTKASSRKNLIKDMDEKMLNASEDWKIENGTDKIVSNTLDVGYDTQMAADAKENLRVIGGVNGNDHVNGGEGTQKMRVTHKDEADKESNMLPYNYRKGTCLFDSRVLTRQAKKARTCVENWTESNLASAEQAVNVKKQLDKQIAGIQPMKAKAGSKENGRKNLRTASKMAEQTKEDRVLVTGDSSKSDENFVTLSNDPKALVKCAVQEQHVLLTPIANRTRRSLRSNRVTSRNAMNNSRDNTDAARSSIIKTTKSGTLFDKGESNSDNTLKNHNSGHLGQSSTKRPINTKSKTHSQLPSANQEASNLGNRKSKRLKTDASSSSIHKVGSNNNSPACGSKRTRTCASKVEEKSSGSRVDVVSVMLKHSKIKDGAGSKNHADIVVCLEASPEDSCTPSVSASATPLGCKTPTIDASPVCMGDEYKKQSCRTNLCRSSLKKELNSLMITIPELTSPVKETRKRKDMVSVRVLFSQHLDPDIIKQQKKILVRLGASKASSMSDATHFVTDMFVRTRNMLEAIASGKPVVTHLWLESCAQASCFIDERNYILRDAKKEKEFGFNMEFSLARACQNPILRGQRVLITPNTKPGKQVLASLVKAAHGLVMERLVRSSLTDEKLANDFLVLSCKEDYDMCLPFLENGASVYSSELLLNGIVTQRLEYERYRLFTDNVKRTRSTTWLKRNNQYVPTNKSK